jgi:hypothetical protein
MAERFPLLEHLQAPNGLAQLRFERYSVYHHRARELGLELHAVPAMAKIYPLEQDELDELAYFFATPTDADPFDARAEAAMVEPATGRERPGLKAVAKAARSWRKATWGDDPPVLTMTDERDALVLRDTRRCASAEVHVLEGLHRAIYLECDRAPTLGSLSRSLAREHGLSPADAELRCAVEALREASLLLAMDDRLVSLATRGTPPPLPPLSRTPGGHVASD